MKIVFAGTPTNAATTLKALVSAGYDVALVITRPDAEVGRKRTLTPSPVAVTATELDLPLLKTNVINDPIREQIANANIDLGIVVAYGSFLDKEALVIPKFGWLNLHYSLLPQYRGAAPVQHALLHGEKITGVTAFKLDVGMDTGDVYGSVSTEIQIDENANRLLTRLTDLGISLLLEIVPAIFSGLAKQVPQSGPVSFAPKLGRSDAEIDWSVNSDSIECKVKAMNPEPVAWTLVDGENFRILNARAVAHHLGVDGEEGTAQLHDGRAIVTCGSGSQLELLLVQPAGKNVMSGADWIRNRNTVRFG